MTMAFISSAHAGYDAVCPKKEELLALFGTQKNIDFADKNKSFDFQATRVDGKGPFKFTALDFKSFNPNHTWINLHPDSTIIYDPTNTDPYHCVAQIWYKHDMEFQLNVKPDKYTGPKK